MKLITNNSKVPLPLAVWAVNDDYDSFNDEKYISATALIKPLRSIILGSRVEGDSRADVLDFIPAALGTAIHTSIEYAWKKNYKKNLEKLSISENVINHIKINPKPGELTPNTLPIYLEKRRVKEVLGWKIGGKFDAVIDGLLHDFKSTSVYSWVHGSNDEAYKLQGSIYRWLNQDIITEDYIRICFIFTDWSKVNAEKDKENYPQQRVLYKDIQLYSIQETEDWITKRIEAIQYYLDKPDNEIPECTDEELWRPAPTYKYYANPEKTDGRATKNFINLQEATQYKLEKGKGIVITVEGTPRRCAYCAANPICEQRKRIFPDDRFDFN